MVTSPVSLGLLLLERRVHVRAHELIVVANAGLETGANIASRWAPRHAAHSGGEVCAPALRLGPRTQRNTPLRMNLVSNRKKKVSEDEISDGNFSEAWWRMRAGPWMIPVR